MESVKQSISLNLQTQSPMPTVNAQKGDTGRILEITLWEGIHRYQIQPDTTAVLTAKKPDGTSLYNICEIRNNCIYYAFTPQTSSCLGTMRAELRLYGAEQALLSTAFFFISIHSTAFLPADAARSQDEQTALDTLVSQTRQLQQELSSWQAEGRFNGESAYQIACRLGFQGTEEQWIDSIRYDHSQEFAELSAGVKADAAAAAGSADSALGSSEAARQHSASADSFAADALAASEAAAAESRSAGLSAAEAASQAEAAQKSAAAAESSAGSGASSALQADQSRTAAEKAAADAREQADRSLALGMTDVRPGDLIKAAEVVNGVVTRWVPTTLQAEEGTWEKIEDITLAEPLSILERSEEPDGTPYRFKKLAVSFILQGAPELDHTYEISTSTFMFKQWIHAIGIYVNEHTANPLGFYLTIYNDGGYLSASAYQPKASYASASNMITKGVNSFLYYQFNVLEGLHIQSYGAQLQSGSHIRIYGVRA